MRSHAVILEPFRTVSETNQREHWATKHRRTKAQRTATFRSLQAALGLRCPLQLPLAITLTRIAPQALDAGNLEASFKAIQDAVADYLTGHYGAGQDRQAGLRWQYAQRRGTVRQYAIHIHFEEMLL